jgi:hypothetical protein
VLNAAEYSEKIEALLLDGLRLFRLNVLGGRFSSNQTGGRLAGSRKHEREL